MLTDLDRVIALKNEIRVSLTVVNHHARCFGPADVRRHDRRRIADQWRLGIYVDEAGRRHDAIVRKHLHE